MAAMHEQHVEEHLIEQIRHHLNGLKEKIILDFSEKSFSKEIASLKSDPIYSKFHLASQEYALIRLMGRISVSIGRRLGEIYDKLPRIIAQSVFKIPPDKISPKMGGKLELDTCLPFNCLSDRDKKHVQKIVKKYASKQHEKGIGIEIRYNFNPNDSARLRKDVDMVNYLIEEKLTPIYLIFSSTSPRDEAIARLKRAGWQFIVGQDAFDFSKELYRIDMAKILEKDLISAEISKKINEIMEALFSSFAFEQVAKSY